MTDGPAAGPPPSRSKARTLRARLTAFVADGFVRRLVKNSSWMVGSQLASAALGLVQVALLSRFLGKDSYGLFVLVSTTAMTARQLLSVRVWEWMTKDFAAALEHHDAARGAQAIKAGLATSAAINAIAFGLLAGAAPLVTSAILKNQVSPWVLIAFGGTFAGSWAYDTCFSALRAAREFRFLGIQGIVLSLVRVVVFGATVVATKDLSSLVFAYVAFETTAGFWILAKTFRMYRKELGAHLWQVKTPSLIQTIKENRRLLVFGSLLDTIKLATSRADVLLLGYLATPTAVALYQAAFNFIDGINRLASPVSLVAFSDLARKAAKGDGDGLVRIVRRTFALGAAGGAALAVFLFVAAGPLVSLAYGSEYADATLVLRLLAVTPLWLSVLWMQPAFASIGKVEWGVEVLIVATIAKVGLLIVLVPRYAEVGLAIANVVHYLSMPLMGPWYLARIKRHLSLSPLKGTALTPEEAR